MILLILARNLKTNFWGRGAGGNDFKTGQPQPVTSILGRHIQARPTAFWRKRRVLCTEKKVGTKKTLFLARQACTLTRVEADMHYQSTTRLLGMEAPTTYRALLPKVPTYTGMYSNAIRREQRNTGGDPGGGDDHDVEMAILISSATPRWQKQYRASAPAEKRYIGTYIIIYIL